MFLIFLISFSLCKIIEIEEDFNKIINNDDDSLIVYAYIKNSRTNYQDFKQIKHDFSILKRISEIFPSLIVGTINCDKYQELCKKNFVEPQNSISFFKNFDKITQKFSKTSQYTNEISLYALSSFISYKSELIPTIKMNEQQYLNENNFTDFIKKHDYNIIFYTSRDSRMSQLLLPTISEISDAFIKDENIGVAEVQCHEIIDFCIKKNIDFVPTIRIYKHKNEENYTDFTGGTRELPYILDFINRECKSYRKSEGKVNMSLYFDNCSFNLFKQKIKEFKKKENIKNEDVTNYLHESKMKCGENTFINRVLTGLFNKSEDFVDINNEDEAEAKLWILNKVKYILEHVKSQNDANEL